MKSITRVVWVACLLALVGCGQKKMAGIQVNAPQDATLKVKVLSGEAALQEDTLAVSPVGGRQDAAAPTPEAVHGEAAPEPLATATGAEHEPQQPVEGIFSYQNYTGLADLVILICDDAARVFSGFYGPSLVRVQPFVFVEDNGQKSITMLGATLADQMAAMINNYPVNLELAGYTEQHLKGVLQEVDGYLRIHISGANQADRRRSYTAQVEMSEGLFRALHSHYVTAGL